MFDVLFIYDDQLFIVLYDINPMILYELDLIFLYYSYNVKLDD